MCGGGLLDIGIYCLQFATLIFGDIEPTDIQVVGALTEGGVDEFASINLKFGEKKIATLCYSVANDFDNTALVFGSKGTIKVRRKSC